MTDKQEHSPNEEPNTEHDDVDITASDDLDDELDIEGALASIASLQTLTEDEDEEEVEDDAPSVDDIEIDETDDDELVSDAPDIQEFERIDDDESLSELEQQEDEADGALETFSDPEPQTVPEATYTTAFPKPPVSVLHRGQLASIVPALLLIGVGGYLTFALTTNSLTLSPIAIIAILIAGLGVTLLAQWLSSSRWSIGSFFIGSLLLLLGATFAYLVLPTNLTLTDGYPLIITAIGTAFVITDIVVPSGRKVWLFGLILAIVGLIGVVTTTVIAETNFASALGSLLPLAIIILAILLIIPIFRRSQ